MNIVNFLCFVKYQKMHVVCIRMLLSASICLSTLPKHEVGFCPNFKICMGCFVHVKLLGVGCFVSLKKKTWWFLSTYTKMGVGCFVRGVFCPTLPKTISPKLKSEGLLAGPLATLIAGHL